MAGPRGERGEYRVGECSVGDGSAQAEQEGDGVGWGVSMIEGLDWTVCCVFFVSLFLYFISPPLLLATVLLLEPGCWASSVVNMPWLVLSERSA